jgi:hypothetical protein
MVLEIIIADTFSLTSVGPVYFHICIINLRGKKRKGRQVYGLN